ncbi:D-galactonate dehydratase [Sphingomonas changbaiensis NBRC 104936]|uniref:D-galactonate dehydratase n=1 Tax=Sphingomonas changbaiensis NBRC 104936 TaxID=1219043 RepID=A0A0E9MJR2_9SPHN|nr:galactonate dehydratase [Sphingomonas changbaiensis]GAO38032.1 D-galactonate dehydratase [Sphingomonas changbaiensis NBRC 104936]
MQIGRIETFIVPPRWLFVRVEADDGHFGWGEASLEGHAEAVEGTFEAYRDRFVGHDPFRIEDIWQIGYRSGFYRGGPVFMSALSGLDQALWDLKGRALGVPAWELLGGRVRDRIRAYAWIGGDRPGEIGAAAKARAAQGFSAVKMNATAELDWLGTPKLLEEVVARVEAAQAEGMDVGLDFHGRVHRPMAKQLAKLLEPLGLLFIEEPLLSENHEGLIQIAQLVSTPIALGERLYSRWDFKRFFESGAVDIIQPDLSHAGGLSECRRIASMAEAYDVAVAPHCPLGPLALAACLQLAGSAPNVAIQEMSLGIHYNTGGHDLLNFVVNKDALSPVDGYLPIPTGPGLGIEIDEAAVREADKDRHRWRNPVWRTRDGSFAEW